MASVDILSSSRPMRFTPIILSSSPLPSPSAILGNNSPLLLTRCRVVPVHEKFPSIFTFPAGVIQGPSQNNFGCVSANGARSFNSVSIGEHTSCQDGSLKSARAKTGRKHGSNDDSNPEGGEMAKESRNAGGQKSVGKLDGKELKEPRKSRAKKGDKLPAGEDSIKKAPAKKLDDHPTADLTTTDKKVRKPRAKKVEESQQKLPKGRITKATSQSKTRTVEAARKTKGIEFVSKHFPSAAETVDPFADPLDHGLVEAVKRRTAWTPPIATSKLSSRTTQLLSGNLEDDIFLSQSPTSEDGSKGFVDLLGSFGFNHSDKSGAEKSLSICPGTRKRKLIELVRTGNQTTAPAQKAVATKKKATTITGLATSAYAVIEDLPVSPAPFLQYFSYRNKEDSTRDECQAPAKSRSKVQRKGSSKTSAAKKGTLKAPILLSPESALKVVGHQDFIFGTSSQLAREESPTLLRDLHKAMQNSNEIDHDPFAESIHESADPLIIPCYETTGTLNKYNMWSAAARDMSGELFDIEMIDLAESPALTKRHKLPTPLETTPLLDNQEEEGLWHDIEELGTSLSLQQPHCSITRSQAEPVKGTLNKLEGISNHLKDAKLSKAGPKQNEVPEQIGHELDNDSGLQAPDYNSYSTAQLAKEVASYRFKPIKNRGQMITLLEKCWQGKQSMAPALSKVNVTAANPAKTSKRKLGAVKASSLAVPKEAVLPRCLTNDDERTEGLLSKPKTRMLLKSTGTCEYLGLDGDVPITTLRTPKKLQKPLQPQNAVCQTIDDISDSDQPCTPSARGDSFQIRAQSQQLNTSNDIDASPELSPASSQARLFTHITRAITSTPPSKDPSNPSWHEKILLYDPIILEDLTVWLNTGALEKTGWDGEVWPAVVKHWCESKSICCLWKANHHS